MTPTTADGGADPRHRHRDEPGRHRRGRARRDAARRLDLDGRRTPRRELLPGHRAVPRRAEPAAVAARAASSSGRAPARSPGCASGSRPPRPWPTGSGSRSSASRPARRCSPRAGDRARARPAPAGRPERSAGRPGRRRRPVLLPGGTEPTLAPDETPRRGRPRRTRAGRRRRPRRARPARASASALAPARAPRGSRPPADTDDLATLVPEYVTLPRGVRAESGEPSHGRATPGEGPRRADAARGPRRGPRDRAGELHRAVAASTPTGASSRRTGSRTTSSPGSADRSSPTAGCG